MRLAPMCLALSSLLSLWGCAEETTTTEPAEFSCSAVGQGQSLTGTATVDAGDLEVRIASDNGRFTEAPAIEEVSSGTLGAVVVDMGVVVVPVSGVGNSLTFDLVGRLTGPRGDFCAVERGFSVAIDADGATVQ